MIRQGHFLLGPLYNNYVVAWYSSIHKELSSGTGLLGNLT